MDMLVCLTSSFVDNTWLTYSSFFFMVKVDILIFLRLAITLVQMCHKGDYLMAGYVHLSWAGFEKQGVREQL